MPGRRREIKKQPRKVIPCDSPVYLSPQHRERTVKDHEKDKTRKDACKTAAVELPCGLFLLHRHEKESRNDYEQRHRHAGKTIINRHPKTVRFVHKVGLGTGHIGHRPGNYAIIVLACMHDHNEETCKHSQIIQKRYTLHNIFVTSGNSVIFSYIPEMPGAKVTKLSLFPTRSGTDIATGPAYGTANKKITH